MTDGSGLYHDGPVMRPVTPDVPTGVCTVCGKRYKLRRRDGTVVMHTRDRRPGELVGTYWCDGGMPAGAR